MTTTKGVDMSREHECRFRRILSPESPGVPGFGQVVGTAVVSQTCPGPQIRSFSIFTVSLAKSGNCDFTQVGSAARLVRS